MCNTTLKMRETFLLLFINMKINGLKSVVDVTIFVFISNWIFWNVFLLWYIFNVSFMIYFLKLEF